MSTHSLCLRRYVQRDKTVGAGDGPVDESASSACRYAIGVLDKTTGRLRIVEAGKQPVALVPEVLGDLVDETKTLANSSSTANKYSVIKNFGSVKRRREQETRSLNMISDANLASTAKSNMEGDSSDDSDDDSSDEAAAEPGSAKKQKLGAVDISKAVSVGESAPHPTQLMTDTGLRSEYGGRGLAGEPALWQVRRRWRI